MNYSQGKRFYVLKSSAASSILQFNSVSGRDAISSRRWFHAYYQGKGRERCVYARKIRRRFVAVRSRDSLEAGNLGGGLKQFGNSLN